MFMKRRKILCLGLAAILMSMNISILQVQAKNVSGKEQQTEERMGEERENSICLAGEKNDRDIRVVGDAKAVKNANSNVTIYALDGWARKYISIPTKYQQSFQIKIKGYNTSKIKWHSEDEEIAYVNSKGVIFPKETEQCYEYDEPVMIYGYAGNKKIEVTVTIKDYSEIYTDEVMDKYIRENITVSMSTYEKVIQICKFVASYNYDVNSSSTEGMIISGGGDCWASTDTVNRMCNKLNISAGIREKANKDIGAGSGHKNSYVVIDGETYIIEAGYNEQAPRLYSLKKVEQPFIYEENGDGTLKITLYEGYYEDVRIPDRIDGKAVSELGEEAFSYHREIKKIVMPDSIKMLGKAVFYECSGLKKVMFSKNVHVIPEKAFSHTNIDKIKIPENIEELQCDSFSKVKHYDGSNGSFGYLGGVDVIEIPKSVKKINLRLTETVVLYHGTKNEWKKLSSSPGKIFYTNKGIALSKSSMNMKQGKSGKLEAYCVDDAFRWTSSNRNVVTVSGGKLKAVGAGISTITVSRPDKKSVSCTIRVNPEKQVLKSLKMKRGRKLIVKWKKNRTATGYQIQYSPDRKFRKSVKTVSISNKGRDSGNVSGLKKGKKYYVRVRSYKNISMKGKAEKLYGEWSNAKRSGSI